MIFDGSAFYEFGRLIVRLLGEILYVD
jgi:hypothetical protein